MHGEDASLRWDIRADMWWRESLGGSDLERVLSFSSCTEWGIPGVVDRCINLDMLLSSCTCNGQQPAVSYRKVERNQEALGPVKQARRNSMVLSDAEPFKVVSWSK